MESKNDTTMLVIGVVILMIALVGSAMFEGNEASGGSIPYSVFFAMESTPVIDTSGSTNEGQTDDVPIDIVGPSNIVTIEFILTWTDDDASEANVGGLGVQNQPDTFTLTVTGLDDLEDSASASNDVNTKNGIIIVNFTFQDFPEYIPIIGSDSNESLERDLTTEYGLGNWSVSITCDEAGDSETTTGQTADQDDGNAWNLEVVATYYSMEIKKAVDQTQ